MNYYYLDSNRNICGPYSVVQMSAFLLNGTITRDTLCAAEGEKNWRPLAEHHWMQNTIPVPPTDLGPMGNCPSCGAEQVGYELAPSCPSCGAAQAPKKSSLWGFFCLALRRLFCFKGRSQRKEYWAYMLFAWIFTMLFDIVILLLLLNLEISLNVTQYIFIFSIIGGLIGLLSYSVMVRRLHDIGLSGYWAIIPFVLNIYGTCVLISSYSTEHPPYTTSSVEKESGTMSMDDFRKKYPDITLSEGQGEIHYSIRRERRSTTATLREMEEMSNRLKYPLGTSPAMVMTARALSLLNYLVGILIILAACIDSQRGTNKYGPSSKYPRAW